LNAPLPSNRALRGGLVQQLEDRRRGHAVLIGQPAPYLFWTISEGGAPVGSAMPPFKQTLNEGDIWKIITYLRAL
jgi:mono/diheme cytochrome c family protein